MYMSLFPDCVMNRHQFAPIPPQILLSFSLKVYIVGHFFLQTWPFFGCNKMVLQAIYTPQMNIFRLNGSLTTNSFYVR